MYAHNRAFFESCVGSGAWALNKEQSIHVRKAGGFAKFWVESVELDYVQGMKVQDLKVAENLINEHKEQINQKWNEIHGS